MEKRIVAGPLASYQRAGVAQVGRGGNGLNTSNTKNTWGGGASVLQNNDRAAGSVWVGKQRETRSVG